MIPMIRAAVISAVAVILSACIQAPITRTTVSTDLASGDRSVLAGVWEYEDSGVVTLTLNEQGHGRYMWKEGRFETTALSGRTWQGRWFQTENDREGGFVVELSPDFSEGEGRWWYTRIGSDHAPTNKGGMFHLSRKTTETKVRETQPVP